MISLDVWFEDNGELIRTEFHHPLLSAPLVAYRGNDGLAHGSQSSFQWTAAVRGLAVLVLRSTVLDAIDSTKQVEPPFIQGERGSLAAALDSAFSKQPQWLTSMFGTDSNGMALSRRIFHRSNPERKRPGPVTISVNTKSLLPESIKVYRAGGRVTDRERLLALARAIESPVVSASSQPSAILSLPHEGALLAPKVATLPTPFGSGAAHKNLCVVNAADEDLVDPAFLATFRQAFIHELEKVLLNTAVFSERAVTNLIRDISRESTFVSLAGRGVSKLLRIGRCLPTSVRLGLSSDTLCWSATEPLKVAIPVIMLGPLCLAWYLKEIRGCPIEIDYSYAYGVELFQRMLRTDFKDTPDVCVVGVAGTARIVSSCCPFEPVMLMPGLRHRIVANCAGIRSGPAMSRGAYYFPMNDPTTPLFCFEDLVSRKIVKRNAVRRQHIEPDEVTLIMKERDPEAFSITWFPVWFLNSQFNSCHALEPDIKLEQELFLFVNRKTCDPNRRLLAEVAFRSAWLELVESRPAFLATVDSMMADRKMLSLLLRVSGFHHLAGNVGARQLTASRLSVV